MSRDRLYERYRELQSYGGWTPEDAHRVAAIASRIVPYLPPMIDDFYAEIDRHAATRKVITGGQMQIDRLKQSLLRWIRELLLGPYDEAYVEGRWRVGVRHVEIGLDQVYANAALARLRTGTIQAVHDEWVGEAHELKATVGAVNKLLDIDLAIIDEAYQAEYLARLEKAERGRLALMKMRSEATFRHLVETAECMIVILRPDYSIDYFSPFAERLTGFPAEQVRGCNFLAAFLLEEDRRPVRDKLSRVLQGCPASGFEHIEISAQDVEIDGRKAIRIGVLDNGPGLDPQQHERIFEPFYTTKAKGTGLGLAIARRVIDAHGGRIAVADTAGAQGALFLITLPRGMS